MKVENAVTPNKEQLAGFLEGDTETPIKMVNLLKFKDKAEYEDGRETSLSGKEAYKIYADEVLGHIERVGGKSIFFGEVQRLMLGEVEELWDWVAIAEYPSRKAMLEMIINSEYQKSEEHRSAGLAGQLNIETKDF
jgi:uncharacterized protein (DUF1330 family)